MKVIIAHPAQQHSFRFATALKKAGILDKYARGCLQNIIITK